MKPKSRESCSSEFKAEAVEAVLSRTKAVGYFIFGFAR